MAYYEILKSLRKKHRMTQLEVSKKLGVSPSAYAMYERGERQPNIEALILLSKLYDVSLDYLLIGTNYKGNGLSLTKKQELLLSLFGELGDEDEQDKVINLIKVALGKYDL